LIPDAYSYLEEEERMCKVSTLVEIICSISQRSAQKTVEEHFEKAGDQFLARCAYEDLGQVLLVVQLSATTDEDEHNAFFRLALEQGIIDSYEYLTCYPVSAFLNPSLDRQEQMRHFPLRPGESWFPAIDHPNKVYICLDKPFMAADQTAWLLEHQLDV
jgi:hypothetical protein